LCDSLPSDVWFCPSHPFLFVIFPAFFTLLKPPTASFVVHCAFSISISSTDLSLSFFASLLAAFPPSCSTWTFLEKRTGAFFQMVFFYIRPFAFQGVFELLEKLGLAGLFAYLLFFVRDLLGSVYLFPVFLFLSFFPSTVGCWFASMHFPHWPGFIVPPVPFLPLVECP